MIENKRFTYKHFDWLQWHIYKNGKYYIEVTNSEEDAKKLCDLLNSLADENEQLKRQVGNLEYTREFCADVCADYERLEKENKELQERNTRQAEQLDRLYKLIEAKDWKALTGIIDDFKRCEELLQNEWGRYCDFE